MGGTQGKSRHLGSSTVKQKDWNYTDSRQYSSKNCKRDGSPSHQKHLTTGVERTLKSHRTPPFDGRTMRASSPCINLESITSPDSSTELSSTRNSTHNSSSHLRQQFTETYASSMEASGIPRRHSHRSRSMLSREMDSTTTVGMNNKPIDCRTSISECTNHKITSISECTANVEVLIRGDDLAQPNILNLNEEFRLGSQEVVKPTSRPTSRISLTSAKFPRKGTEMVDYPRDLPIGDVQSSITKKIKGSESKVKSNRRTPCLTEKPPTPPPKMNAPKSTRPMGQIIRPVPAIRSSQMRRSFSPVPGRQSPCRGGRASSLPRPATADHWSSPENRAFNYGSAELRQKRALLTAQQVETELFSDQSQCLSRIEYTFYINDNEAYQRPFYDRRVEAIARACQCTVCLHKPPLGQKPVYYKGLRVLPVTISARTMVSLKRCIARLDMQYPYFNTKAFCPPDMY